MIKIYLFFLFIPFLIIFPLKAITHKEIISDLYKINTNINKKEERFGKMFIELRRKLKRGQLNYNEIKKVHLKSKIIRIYRPFTPILKKGKNIVQNKVDSKFIRECSSFRVSSNHPSILSLIRDLKKYCYHKFLAHIKSNPTILVSNDKFFNFFKKHYEFFKARKMQSLISSILRRLNNDESAHTYVSNFISQFYISTKIVPPHIVLKNLKSSKALQAYLQEIKLPSQREVSQLNRNFRSLRKKFYKSIRDEDFDKAIDLINYAISIFSENKRYLNWKTAWTFFITAGKKLLFNDIFDQSLFLFKYAESISKREEKEESLFFIIWAHTLRKNYQNALKEIKNYQILENLDQYGPKLKFWVAKILTQMGRKGQANKLLKKVAVESPLNFYSVVSLKYLNDENFSNQVYSRKLPFKGKYKKILKKNFNSNLKNGIKRLKVWIKLNHFTLINQELEFFHRAKSQYFLKFKSRKRNIIGNSKVGIGLFIADLLYRKGLFLNSFKFIHKLLKKDIFTLNYLTMKYLFPFNYLEKIKKLGKGLDPILVLSLIRQESAFNPQAISRVGARGIMQIMPGTARRFYKKIRAKDLRKPHLNLKIGIKYLKGLLKRYDGNMIYTLSAYNAGENRIKRWIQEIFVSDNPLIMIESIPFKETRFYVKLIYRNMFFYRSLIKSEKNKIPLYESFKISYNPKPN